MLPGDMEMTAIDFSRPGPWRELWRQALRLMSHLEKVTVNPPWTFGGGTALMLRFDHRLSKDIDLFVPDPQYLGHVNPRLGGPAEELTSEYEENAQFIKLQLEAGEIDVVVGEPLTAPHYEWVHCEGRPVRVETSAEIIAKKMWHRGDQAKARDLFDLCTVATFEPAAIDAALPYMKRHAAAFLRRLDARVEATENEFNLIEARSFQRPFGECLVLAHAILDPLITAEERKPG
jgi:predicted nucleotidyltransferase component of viral defense system